MAEAVGVPDWGRHPAILPGQWHTGCQDASRDAVAYERDVGGNVKAWIAQKPAQVVAMVGVAGQKTNMSAYGRHCLGVMEVGACLDAY